MNVSRVVSPFRWRLLAALSLFLLVVGARFWLVQKYTTPLPFWDSWDAEGTRLLLPWLEGRLHWADMFAAHAEHRIFMTRAFVLGLFMANRQWDGQLGPAADALLVGGFAAVLAMVLLRLFAPCCRWQIVAAVAVTFIPPFGWENTLWSFGSQNYFLVMFSLTAMWGLGRRETGDWRWWLGLVGGVCACLSAGSGMMAAATVLSIRLLRNLKDRAWPSVGDVITDALCMVMVAAGLASRVVVPLHAVLMSHTLGEHVLAFGRYLAWPFFPYPLMSLWMVAPLGWLTVAYLSRPLAAWGEAQGARRQLVELLLTVGGWVGLQVLALAHVRGASAELPPSRYTDFLIVGVLVNFLTWLVICSEPGLRRPWRWGAVGLAALWSMALLNGVVTESRHAFEGWMPAFRDNSRTSEQNVRGYVLTHDYERYLADKPLHDLPFPFVPWLRLVLDAPALRPYFPEDIREPVALTPDTPPPGTSVFAPGGTAPGTAELPLTPVFGSYLGSGGAAAQAVWHGRLTSSAERPYLRFFFAGDLHAPGLGFILRDAATGQAWDWHPKKAPGERWHGDAIRKPGSELRVEAMDQSATGWFAFSAPVEIGRLSYWSSYFLRRAVWIFGAGVVVLVFLIVWSGVERFYFRRVKR